MAHAENSGFVFFVGFFIFLFFFGSLAISLVALLVSRALLPARRESACALPFVPIKRDSQLHVSVFLATLLLGAGVKSTQVV